MTREDLLDQGRRSYAQRAWPAAYEALAAAWPHAHASQPVHIAQAVW